MRLLAVTAATLAGLALGLVLAQSSPFVETWDGDPASPHYLGGTLAPSDWDIQLSESNRNFWTALPTGAVNAQHQPDCGDPFHDGSGWHPFDGAYESVVYRCSDHVMTFLGHGGYAAVYMTPNHLLDLRGGQGVVSFEVSTLHPQARDWIDLWITPWSDNLAVPLELGGDAFQGPPRNAIQVVLGGSQDRGGFTTRITRDYATTDLVRLSKATLSSTLTDCAGPTDPSTTCGPSAKNRYTVEIVLSQTHIKVWMPQTGIVWQDDDIAPLGWDLATVQWGHHRYNADIDKGCTNPIPGQICANTWHWDNHAIDPALPFTMIKADKRQALDGDTIALSAPAPEAAYLRFSAVGTVEVSYDGGPYELAQRQTGGLQAIGQHRPWLASSYWTPIPVGTTAVTFRLTADDGYSAQFQATDFGVWSLVAAPPPPTPTPTPILTPTPTPTAEPDVCEVAMEEVHYLNGVEVSRIEVSRQDEPC